MKAALFVLALTWWFGAVVPAATVEMTAGPDLKITYDSALWKLVEPVREAEPGVRQVARWMIEHPEWAQITVASHHASKTEAEYKQEIVDCQKFRGDPADLIRQRRESLGDRDWLVLEFRNRHTHPPRSEIHYFLSTGDGYASLTVIGEEASLPKHREAIDGFLRRIHLK